MVCTLGILITGELGITYYVSGSIEQRFREIEALLNENQLVASEVVSFKRGFFHSEMVTSVRFKNLPLEKPFQIKHTIFNGPIILQATEAKPIQFKLAVIRSEPIETTTTHKISFLAITNLLYSGAIESQTAGSAYNVQNGQFQVSGQSWSSEYSIASDKKSWKGNVIFPQINLQSMSMNLALEELQVIFDQSRSPFGNWLGTVSLTLKNGKEPKENFQLNQLKLVEDSVFREQVIDVFWDLELGKMVLMNENYGPFSVKMQVINLDPAGLMLLSNNNGNGYTQEGFEKLLQEFLTKNPKMMIEPSQINLPQGSIQLDAELGIGGPDMTFPLNLEQFEKSINGYFHLLIPKELFIEGLTTLFSPGINNDPKNAKLEEAQKKTLLDQQVTQKINKLKQDGILIEKDKDYDFKISIMSGKWVSNGKEVARPFSDNRAPTSQTGGENSIAPIK